MGKEAIMGALIFAWVKSNPLKTGLIAALFSVTLYAGTQKVKVIKLNNDIHGAGGYIVQLGELKQALKTQSDAIDRMGEETDRLNSELERAGNEAGQVMRAADKRIEHLETMDKANDCRGNLTRFTDQLGGTLWHTE